jgi:DNA-binding FadR family transcriptional regulator
MKEPDVRSPVRAAGAKALATWLHDEILSGRLREGVKLPAERQLSEQFGASRGAVRRVLQDLRERGLITQTVGSGTFVQAGAMRSLSLPGQHAGDTIAMPTSPAELMEARRLIEPMMLKLITHHATTLDFARMTECIERSEAAGTIEEFEHWDGELHRTFALATHNSFFVKVYELMNEVRDQGEWGRLKRLTLTPERRKDYETQHRAIVAALCDRDAEQAGNALKAHLRHVEQDLFG